MTATLRWAVTFAGVAVLAALVAVVVGVAGLFGFASADPGGGEKLTASVVSGAACADPNAKEIVTLTVDGKQRQARLDGCGHSQNDVLTVTVPSSRPTDASGDLVVHGEQAEPGVNDAWRPIGLVLLALAGMAGAAYALLYLRKPAQRQAAAPLTSPQAGPL